MTMISTYKEIREVTVNYCKWKPISAKTDLDLGQSRDMDQTDIGAVIGAITFSGSVIAFGKLQGIMSGAPIIFKGQHFLNLLIGLVIVAGVVYLCMNQSANIFWFIIILFPTSFYLPFHQCLHQQNHQRLFQ